MTDLEIFEAAKTDVLESYSKYTECIKNTYFEDIADMKKMACLMLAFSNSITTNSKFRCFLSDTRRIILKSVK